MLGVSFSLENYSLEEKMKDEEEMKRSGVRSWGPSSRVRRRTNFRLIL